jgi:hypothetical protein
MVTRSSLSIWISLLYSRAHGRLRMVMVGVVFDAHGRLRLWCNSTRRRRYTRQTPVFGTIMIRIACCVCLPTVLGQLVRRDMRNTQIHTGTAFVPGIDRVEIIVYQVPEVDLVDMRGESKEPCKSTTLCRREGSDLPAPVATPAWL